MTCAHRSLLANTVLGSSSREVLSLQMIDPIDPAVLKNELTQSDCGAPTLDTVGGNPSTLPGNRHKSSQLD